MQNASSPDTSGLVARDFCVHELFDTLLENISALASSETPSGTMRSLRAKVLAAQTSYSKGNHNAAINQLNALINELQAITGNQISPGDAQNFTGQAQTLINDLQ